MDDDLSIGTLQVEEEACECVESDKKSVAEEMSDAEEMEEVARAAQPASSPAEGPTVDAYADELESALAMDHTEDVNVVPAGREVAPSGEPLEV